MNTKQKRNWVLDAILFVIFIFTFLLDLTGVVLHQWLGIIAGAIATIHLIIALEMGAIGYQSILREYFDPSQVVLPDGCGNPGGFRGDDFHRGSHFNLVESGAASL